MSSTGGADPTGLLAEAEELRAERNRRLLEGAELLRLLKASKLLRTVRARRLVVERIADWCSERGRSPEELAQVLESLERHATGWKSPQAAVVTLTETPEDLDALWSEIEQGTLQAEHQRQAERLEVERQTELLRRSMLEAVLHPLGLEGWRGQGSNPVRWRDWPKDNRATCEQAAARLKAEPEYRAELEEHLRATEERLRALDATRAPELAGGEV